MLDSQTFVFAGQRKYLFLLCILLVQLKWNKIFLFVLHCLVFVFWQKCNSHLHTGFVFICFILFFKYRSTENIFVTFWTGLSLGVSSLKMTCEVRQLQAAAAFRIRAAGTCGGHHRPQWSSSLTNSSGAQLGLPIIFNQGEICFFCVHGHLIRTRNPGTDLLKICSSEGRNFG